LDLSRIRNVGIIAHIDAGKTTLSERILFYTKKEHKMGTVDEGTAKMDYLQDEQARGITITSAATTCLWNDHQINLIDTPGHVDFTAEVERSLRVLDGAIGVFCGVAGVQAQSETVWRQADRYRVPRIAFVNKLDRTGSSFDKTVASIRDRLGVNAVSVQIPLIDESRRVGVIDLVRRLLLRFPEDSLGETILQESVPADLRERAEQARLDLIEKVASEDEDLMEMYVHERTIEAADLAAAIRRSVIARRVVPVFGGAALRNFGVQPVLDAVVQFLPSPLDVGPVRARRVGSESTEEFKPDPGGELLALAFKTIHDPHGDLTFLRMYSGELRPGDNAYVPRINKVERIGRLFVMHADERESVEVARAGEIVAAVGLRNVQTGDTLCLKKHAVELEGMLFPQTVISMSIEPRTSADRDALDEALRILARDDPTFRFEINEETGQAVVSGMGELHLEILGNRLTRDFKVPVRLGKPRVAYRQTVRNAAEVDEVFERQIGGRNHFGRIRLRVEPQREIVPAIEIRLDKERVPRVFWDPIRAAAQGALRSGLDLGYPIVRVRVVICDGEVREMESTEIAMVAATTHAFGRAMELSGVDLLEPIMRFAIVTPAEYMKAVLGDLSGRRGRLEEMDTTADPVTISGTVPLAEIFGYSTAIRSLSQGRASFTVEPSDYWPVPEEVAQQLRF